MQPESAPRAQALWTAVKRIAHRAKKTTLVVCPPFPYLSSCAKSYDGTVLLGAQDVSVFKDGAHTGEVSPAMLKDLRVRFVIVGHSERRALGETDAYVAQKVKMTLAQGMRPVVCVGEHERGVHGDHLMFLQKQITESLKGIGPARARDLVVAYEPLWAIGKSFKYAVSPHDIHETSIFIRKTLAKLLGRSVGTAIPILYGGSVEAENIAEIVSIGEVDGVLVGHASLDSDSVKNMVRALEAKR